MWYYIIDIFRSSLYRKFHYGILNEIIELIEKLKEKYPSLSLEKIAEVVIENFRKNGYLVRHYVVKSNGERKIYLCFEGKCVTLDVYL